MNPHLLSKDSEYPRCAELRISIFAPRLRLPESSRSFVDPSHVLSRELRVSGEHADVVAALMQFVDVLREQSPDHYLIKIRVHASNSRQGETARA